MKSAHILPSLLLLSSLAVAAPTIQGKSLSANKSLEFTRANFTSESLKRGENADADDRVVYTWSLPSETSKRTENADADDKIVYTWSLPDVKMKRAEATDADDRVVYTWSLPEEK